MANKILVILILVSLLVLGGCVTIKSVNEPSPELIPKPQQIVYTPQKLPTKAPITVQEPTPEPIIAPVVQEKTEPTPEPIIKKEVVQEDPCPVYASKNSQLYHRKVIRSSCPKIKPENLQCFSSVLDALNSGKIREATRC